MILRLPTAAVLVISLGFLAGCSGDEPASQATTAPTTQAVDSTTSAAPAPAGGSPSEPCALLPGDSVGEVFGISEVTAKPLPEQTASGNNAKVYVCEYTATAANTALGGLTVSVHEGNQITAPAMIDAVKARYTDPQEVPGVGEAAATFEDGDSRYLAAAKVVSGTPIMVMYIGSKNASAENLTALVGPVMEQL